MLIRETTERVLPYCPEQLFEIASDVERYPEFVPWWVAVRVRDRQAGGYCTDQVLGLGPLRLQFASQTLLDPPRRIEVSSSDSAFQRFGISWLFDAQGDAGCRVSLLVDVELRSRVLRAIMNQVAPDTAGSIMAAFEARAGKVCAPMKSA